MAEDVIALLDYVGWTNDIHIVGVSLGGMIAQGRHCHYVYDIYLNNFRAEVAIKIPDRIVSLSLCVTKAGGFSWANHTPVSGSDRPHARLTPNSGMAFPAWLGKHV